MLLKARAHGPRKPRQRPQGSHSPKAPRASPTREHQRGTTWPLCITFAVVPQPSPASLRTPTTGAHPQRGYAQRAPNDSTGCRGKHLQRLPVTNGLLCSFPSRTQRTTWVFTNLQLLPDNETEHCMALRRSSRSSRQTVAAIPERSQTGSVQYIPSLRDRALALVVRSVSLLRRRTCRTMTLAITAVTTESLSLRERYPLTTKVSQGSH
jgi:hypothetical protein